MEGVICKTIRVGGIEATISKTEKLGVTGGEFASHEITYTVSLVRNYKDRNGEWKKSEMLRQVDMPKAILALQKAYEYLALCNNQED